MQIKFDANKKRLDTTPAFGLLVQGENLAESIQITGPKMVGALDLSQLRVAVRMTSQQYETTVEKTLEQDTDGDTITFTWQVDKQFTGSPGKVDVMLVGYGGNDEVIKITSSGMVVQEDRTFDTAPPESTWEQILQQMQDFATQAYESKTAAANSAAEAAASQKVAEEKAEQATNAASEAVKAAETAAADAAAQAAAKTEQQIRQYADDRYARPLVTQTGPAASLEVYPDTLSNLKVYANGFTVQTGADITSKTNLLKPNEDSHTGITVKKNSDGSVRVSGTATSRSWPRLGNIVIPTSEIYGDVTISFKSAVDRNIVFKLGDGTEHVIQKGKTSITANIPSDAVSGIHVFLVVPEGESIDQTYYVMVNKGTTAAPFVPYIEGTGAPTPVNSRAITNGGTDNYFVPEMLAPEVTWDAETKTLTKPSSTGIYYDIFNGTTGLNTVATNYIQLLPNTKYVFSAGACDTATEVFVVANDGTVSKITGNLANASIEAETGETGRITIRMYNTGKSKAANLSIKKYNTEEIFDYVVSKSGINGVTFLPLTAPLCKGDSVASYIKSGCDKFTTFDGSEDEGWTNATTVTSGVNRWGVQPLNIAPADNNSVATVFSPRYSPVSGANTYNKITGISVDGSGNLLIYDDTCTSNLEEWKAALAAHPLTVWYRSTNYTEAADIPVSLETHVNYAAVLTGEESVTPTVSGGGNNRYEIKIPGPAAKPATTYAQNTLLACTHFKTDGVSYLWGKIVINTITTNKTGLSFVVGLTEAEYPTEDAVKAYLAAQYAAGTPVTIVYQLAAPITYAHPAVVLPALPDDTGKVTITGQSGGTVTVVFNKSIIKEIAEIKAAMLAMGANLSM